MATTSSNMSAFGDALEARGRRHPSFNFEFPVFLIVAGILAILFLLYANRLFGSAVSWGIRTWTWHKYRVYIDVTALQISLLGGRIFFTGLRYHGKNETFLVQYGYITWRYWLRRVREVDIHAEKDKEGDPGDTASGKSKNKTLPCRINVRLIGLEWFVYNRSPAYDTILSGLTASDPPESRSTDTFNEKDQEGLRQRSSGRRDTFDDAIASRHNPNQDANGGAKFEKETGYNVPLKRRLSSLLSGSVDGNAVGEEEEPGLPFMLQFFPIHVECEKAAAVIGNENTKAVLIVHADTVLGDVDASETTTCDPYKQTFNIQFQHPVVEMKENDDFKEDQVARSSREKHNAHQQEPVVRRSIFHRHRRRVLTSLRNLVPLWQRSVESVSTEGRAYAGAASRIPGSNHWQGLSRYLDDQYQDDKARWTSVEYAALTTILDCPSAVMNVYWDVVTKVTTTTRQGIGKSNINGDDPPSWGMHFSINGGTLNYGPWADRQRADLQRVFFPTISKDASPAKPLPVGAWRAPTQFRLLVELEDSVTFRIPIREESKNWRWRGKEPQMKHENITNKRKQRNRAKKNGKAETTPLRPAGWLEVKVPHNSTVTYSMDMFAASNGYENLLNIDLPSTELWSSVNHDLLWQSGAQRISCDMSNPLSWNSLRNWHFDVVSDDLKLYLLRDHMFLLIDLVDDWSSGPPVDYLVFTPFKYHLNLTLRNLQLYLNVNDANIIDKATSLDENAYLILSSPLMTAETSIPIDSYRPSKNAIPFNVKADTLDLLLHTPQSNTLGAFLSSNEIGHIDGMELDGSYHYNATTSPANTDTLVLSIHGQSPYAYLYGFVVRYFIVMKDNYFGDHIHFRTLEEYREQLQVRQSPDDLTATRPPHKKSNDLDVILSIKADDPRIMLPTNLYSASSYVQCELASLFVDLRFTNYYMDMELDLSPLNLSLGSVGSDLDSPNMASSNTQLFIDGIRVFGHRLFGLPPTEPTYLCNWDVAAGAVNGECTSDFLAALASGGKAFGFMFDDVENALVPYSSLVFNDITFVRVAVASVRLWLHVEDAAFLVSTDAINVKSNDWARSHYSKRANIHVPNVQISCVNAESAARQKSRHHPVDTEAFFRTDIYLATIGRKFHFTEERKLQQELVRREDQRTHRTDFLLIPEYMDDFIPEAVDPPAQCAPPPPHPIVHVDDENSSSYDDVASHRSHRVTRKSSFLSSSSIGSIRQDQRRQSQQGKSRPGVASLPVSKAEDGVRPSLQRREPSASSGRLSSFYSAAGEYSIRESLHHSSVAFSSQYFSPHFALDGIQPDTRDAAFQSVEKDDSDDFLETTAALLEDIDPASLSEDHAYSSIMVEFPSGITAVLNPATIRYATSLLTALQPKDPEDVLDALQASTMTEIFDSQKQEKVHGEIKDILIRIPKANIRLLNSSTLDSPDPSLEEQDQYDLTISKFALVTRTSGEWDHPSRSFAKNERASFHFRLGQTELSASERISTLAEPQAALMIQIDSVMASLGAKDVTYFDVDIGPIIGNTASGKVEYLASLIHRTGSVATELGHMLADATAQHKNRLQYLTYRLLKEGKSTNDPAFLIRPSAVLRSAQDHLRTFDSWKLMMRLRQIWSTMRHEASTTLAQDCWSDSSEVPSGATQFVLQAFEHWRSWDLENLSQALLLKTIFGNVGNEQKQVNDERPLLGACRLAEIKFVLDPGPKENRLGLVDVTARVEKNTVASESTVADLPKTAGPLAVLNISCGEAAANINWELCELAEDVVRFYNRNQLQNPPNPTATKTPTGPQMSPLPAMHVILEVMEGSLEVETVNLALNILSNGLRTSILTYGEGESAVFTNVILNYDAVTTRLQSHSQVLGLFQLREPSVFVSHDIQQTDSRSVHTIKSTASSRSLTLAVKQDPLALIEVLDLVIRDEFAQLYRFKSQVPAAQGPKEAVKILDRLSTIRVNVALFLDNYIITVPLLQTLTYKITGVVARAACAANYGKEIIFDFDIKENFHETQINVRDEPRSISLLQIPPTNGRITHHTNQSETMLTVLSSLEVVQLDASEVYGLLSALNQPQISSAIQEIQVQMKAVQQHISEIFGPEEAPTVGEVQQQPSTTLVYNVRLVSAGLRVIAQTALKSETEPIAQVLFSLGRGYLQASNRHEDHGPILNYPDLHLNLRGIGLDISRGKEGSMRSCGSLGAGVTMSASPKHIDDGTEEWSFDYRSDDLDVNLSPETISTTVGVLTYLGEKIKDLDTSRELDYLRKLRQPKPKITINDGETDVEDTDLLDSVLASVIYHIELRNIRVSWNVADSSDEGSFSKEDLVLSIKLIELGTRTKTSARLTIENFQLQTVAPGQDKNVRSLHSALMPEVVFNIAYVSTLNARRMAFQAVGQSLDLQLTSAFILPAAHLVESISLSMQNAREATAEWNTALPLPKKPDESQSQEPQRSLFGKKRMESLLIDADFAGAVVYLSSKRATRDGGAIAKYGRPSLAGKYGQFNTDDSGSGAVLRSPGLAWKIEYRDDGKDDPALYGEIKIDASSNILYPSVVPLIMDIMSSVKEVVSEDAEAETEPEPEREPEAPKLKPETSGDEDNILNADPSAMLGRVKLNIGLRICRQEFSLSCQPIARVAATAWFDNIYFTVNTVSSQEHGSFFAMSGAFTKLQASVKHVYSREPTGSFDVESITLSVMNSKHVSGTSGVSVILNVAPMKVMVNAKQVQDFLLFGEIWYPKDLRRTGSMQVAKLQTETSQGHLVQRYQQVAATAAFPWTVTISIAALDVNVDLGQTIGRSVFAINNFWVSSKKSSDWEQNLCLGFDKIGIDCTGRLSGFVGLQKFRLRTSIQWPKREQALNETPLVQASLSFHEFRLKAAFDYQAFLVADITSMEFLMYNVRESGKGSGDRLVAMFDGEAVQVFGTTTSAAQIMALLKAIQKLIQERRENFQKSLKEIEKFMKPKSNTSRTVSQPLTEVAKQRQEKAALAKSPISLDTDVVVTLKALNLGIFPSTFSDNQVFKMEALNAYASFAASVEQARVHSVLRMRLGQLRIGLAGVRDGGAPKTLSELSVEDVVRRATGSRGGTILKVPQVAAAMETWQSADSNQIDYVFKSAFEGKVEVGWNYSRISYIRGMFANHAKSLEQVWGRELPMAAVKITGVPGTETEAEQQEGERQKITAEVTVPQSRYTYMALEPPIIVTPQLRDMGEATPPLEWIGLHRDRLPNLTHQIVIVALLELAGEVEDAYSQILGSS